MTDALDSFDDDAIRIELRRIVENAEIRILETFAAAENEIKAAHESAERLDVDAKRKIFSELEARKSDVRLRFRMMRDFIERQ